MGTRNTGYPTAIDQGLHSGPLALVRLLVVSYLETQQVQCLSCPGPRQEAWGLHPAGVSPPPENRVMGFRPRDHGL